MLCLPHAMIHLILGLSWISRIPFVFTNASSLSYRFYARRRNRRRLMSFLSQLPRHRHHLNIVIIEEQLVPIALHKSTMSIYPPTEVWNEMKQRKREASSMRFVAKQPTISSADTMRHTTPGCMQCCTAKHGASMRE
jgi:hypothetical protein